MAPAIDLSRRRFLQMLSAAPFAQLPVAAARSPSQGLSLDALKQAPGRVLLSGGGRAPDTLRLVREWKGPVCRSRLTNRGRERVRVERVVLCEVADGLPPETRLYGEGFQMLSQTGGTRGQPAALGDYTDPRHYRLPQPEGSAVVYGLLTLAEPDGPHHLLAFASCRRFSGQLTVRGQAIEAAVDTEGLELGPGESWELEELTYRAGPDRPRLLDDLAARLAENHPPLPWPSPPSGWCSWYCFGPRVTARQVLDNLEVIAREVPGLKYVQIDDGYQPAMGDWLETGAAFGGDVRAVLRQIRERGFEPAIWVAPFIAEQASRVFKEHADWFVKEGDGSPLRSDKVTFGGWRHGPWYALDGTHPDARRHLQQVFRTMREEWGCTYFKLDANFWGAIHGGRFHDPRATRVEAYRRGMEAVRRGAGDAFLLGCNHPIWASLGTIHGSRSSNDIKRSWGRVSGTARQNLLRNWQNGRLWWNDPDAVVLTGGLSEEEVRFHATAIYASGGMLLSGDDLTQIPAARLAMLRRLEPPTGVAARFADDSLTIGTVQVDHRFVVCLLNWDDAPRTLSVPLPRPLRVVELWTDEDRGRHEGSIQVGLPPRSGRVLICTPAG
jgi:alpha-galactosidase